MKFKEAESNLAHARTEHFSSVSQKQLLAPGKPKPGNALRIWGPVSDGRLLRSQVGIEDSSSSKLYENIVCPQTSGSQCLARVPYEVLCSMQIKQVVCGQGFCDSGSGDPKKAAYIQNLKKKKKKKAAYKVPEV